MSNVKMSDQKNFCLKKVFAAIFIFLTLILTAFFYAPSFKYWVIGRFNKQLQLIFGLERIQKIVERGFFYYPSSLAIDSEGVLYVADTGNRVIKKVSTTGVVTSVSDEAGVAIKFEAPVGVAVDSAQNIYVADQVRGAIYKITKGKLIFITGKPGVRGFVDGKVEDATFNYPTDLALDSAGNIYVADSGNDTVRKITPSGIVSTVAGMSQTPGRMDSTFGSMRMPRGLCIDQSQNVFIADFNNHLIRKLSQQLVTLAGTGEPGTKDGIGKMAEFNYPASVVTDTWGNVYVSDMGNHAIRILTPSGEVRTFAGKIGESGDRDGTGKDARFKNPIGIVMDSSGNLYVADSGNSVIRKIKVSSGEVTTFAGK